MKTLVIHPEDESTDFLKLIYQNLKATVITGGLKKEEVINSVEVHDRIIMMGHGCPNGLFAVNRFEVEENLYSERLIVDDCFVSLLKKKKDNVFIWCNADQFIEKHDLKGLYTGMFISEIIEAFMYEIDTDEESIKLSNQLFSELLSPIIHVDNKIIHQHLKQNYKNDNNPVCRFNNDRLFIR